MLRSFHLSLLRSPAFLLLGLGLCLAFPTPPAWSQGNDAAPPEATFTLPPMSTSQPAAGSTDLNASQTAANPSPTLGAAAGTSPTPAGEAADMNLGAAGIGEGGFYNQFLELYDKSGAIAKAVLWLLIIMSVLSIGIMVDRAIELRRNRVQSMKFLEKVQDDIEKCNTTAVLKAAREFKKSHVARSVEAAMDIMSMSQVDVIHGHMDEVLLVKESAKHASERAAEDTSVDLKRGLGVLANTGATAPFVGLFGTTVGIINSFQGIARTGSGGLSSVAAGISEALIATAMGIFVALPSVWAYNYFVTQIENYFNEMTNISSEIVDRMVLTGSIRRKTKA